MKSGEKEQKTYLVLFAENLREIAEGDALAFKFPLTPSACISRSISFLFLYFCLSFFFCFVAQFSRPSLVCVLSPFVLRWKDEDECGADSPLCVAPCFQCSFPYVFSPFLPFLSLRSSSLCFLFFVSVFFVLCRSCLFFRPPVCIPSLASIVGEWHAFPSVMKTQDRYCRSSDGRGVRFSGLVSGRRRMVLFKTTLFDC